MRPCIAGALPILYLRMMHCMEHNVQYFVGYEVMTDDFTQHKNWKAVKVCIALSS